MKELIPNDKVTLRFNHGGKWFFLFCSVSMVSKEMIIFKTRSCTPVIEFVLRPGQFKIENYTIDIKVN
jgi:hypothetical protein